MKTNFRARTLIDELRENWPRLDTIKMNLVALVYQFPEISMTEAAETLGLTVQALQCQARTLAGGYGGRDGYGFLSIGIGDDDQRERPMKLTTLGLKAAKLISTLNTPVDEEMKIQRDENQLDLSSQTA